MPMRPIVMMVQMFMEETPADDAASRKKLLYMMEALTRCNQEFLKIHPETPGLYQSGVVYQPEFGTEDWQDIPTTVGLGYGDCEDLACWRVAEMRQQGIPASPYIRWRMVHDQYRFHALVEWPARTPSGEWNVPGAPGFVPDLRGKIEDPSLRLGMKKWAAYLSSPESVR